MCGWEERDHACEKREKRGGPSGCFWLVKWMSGLRYSSPMFFFDLPENERWEHFTDRCRTVLDCKSEQKCPIEHIPEFCGPPLEMP